MATKYSEDIYPSLMSVHRGFQFVIENTIREIPTMVCIWLQGGPLQEGSFVAITWHSLQ